jgi:hypothetical protein
MSALQLLFKAGVEEATGTANWVNCDDFRVV